MDSNILKAIFLNCTLKKSPAVSNTNALIDKAAAIFHSLNVETETIRIADHNVPFGVELYTGTGDEWPLIFSKIKESDIVIIGMPIWMGTRSSVCQLVMERLDGSSGETNPINGQYPLYNKAGGVIITGNEDGAHDCAANTLFNLTRFGCAIPPNADCYWVGDAGPGPSYIQAGGDKHLYTNRTAKYMVYNLVYLAKLLKEHPIPTDLTKLGEDAKKESSKSS
jgi:multimeric flavodoxin WrbA